MLQDKNQYIKLVITDAGSSAESGIELIANTAGETGVKNSRFLAFQSPPKTTSLAKPQEPASTRNSRLDAVCFEWRLHPKILF
jgi:hypothetical protein